MKNIILICIVIGYNAAGQGASKYDNYSLGFKLTVIEGKANYVALEDDLRAKRYNSLLKQLDKKYVETEERIGDMAVTARKILLRNGVEESFVNILEGMNLLFVREYEGMQFAEYISIYVAQRNKGMSHHESIKRLTAMLRSLEIY